MLDWNSPEWPTAVARQGLDANGFTKRGVHKCIISENMFQVDQLANIQQPIYVDFYQRAPIVCNYMIFFMTCCIYVCLWLHHLKSSTVLVFLRLNKRIVFQSCICSKCSHVVLSISCDGSWSARQIKPTTCLVSHYLANPWWVICS